jgi:hypothetical protein
MFKEHMTEIEAKHEKKCNFCEARLSNEMVRIDTFYPNHC